MSNPAVQLADAVVHALRDEAVPWTWPERRGHAVARTYRPTHDLEDLDTLRVTVTPAGLDITPLGRGEHDRRLAVLVALQTRCGPEETERLDELAGIASDIGEYLTDRRLEQFETARFTGLDMDPLFHPDILETQRVFLAPLLVKYRILN